jgi:proto-oncogene tyrosine-protein kinase ROS
MKYFETGLFTGKHIMGLSLNFDKNLIFWIVRSFDKAMLFSAHLANRDNLHQISHTIRTVGQISETNIRGPLVYFSDRMFWLQENHNEALITDVEGKNLAYLRGPGLLDINTLTIVDPSLQPLPNGFETLNDIVVIPNDVKADNIKVIGTGDNFTIIWESVDNVNYDQIFYDLVLEDRHHYTHTMITGDTKYSYPSTSHLPPYSKIKLAIRAFTYWASSKQTITEIYSPMSIPSKPSKPRVFINYERSMFDNSIQKIHAEFRWSPPELPNGIILGYIVNAWSIQSGQRSTEVENFGVKSNQIHLSDLKINTTYYFQVQAFTEAGEGPISEIIGAHSSEEHPVPRLLVAKSNSIIMADIDSHEEKMLTSKAISPVSVTYISKENKLFWIEEDGVLKSAYLDGSNVTIIHQMSSSGTGLTVDWISRHLYWSERNLSTPKSTIWSYDLNDPKAKPKPTKVTTESHAVIGSIEIEPFSSILIWTELFDKNRGTLKMCSTSTLNSSPNIRSFFQQNNSRNKRALNETCNCATHPRVSNAIAIDRSNYGKSELLWVDSKYGRIMASDMSGCHCRILINSTYSFPPTSLTVDNDFIYWSNSSLGNVYKIIKNKSNSPEVSVYKAVNPLVINSLQSLSEPHLVLSEAVHGVHGIRALSDHLQPYPNFECLVPMEHQGTVKLIDNTANSLTIEMHEVRRPLGCSKTTLASVLYTIFYGKVLANGYYECGLSLRGCKTIETYNHTITISGLEPYTNYTIRVAEKNYYTPTDSVNLPGSPVNLETAESKPSPPRNVIAKVETPHKIIVTWEPPEKPNGDPILYEMRWYSSRDQNWHKAIYAKKPNTTRFGDKFFMTLTNIRPALTYYITVRAYSSDSIYHSDSNIVSATTYSLPNEIILEERSSRVIRVSWISPNSNSNESEIGQHTMQYSMIGNQQWIGHEYTYTKPSTKYEFTVNNLIPNTEYAFRLLLTYRSTTSLFEWPENDKYIFKTLGDAPEIPEKPKIDDIGIEQHVYKVWWDSVNGNGAQTIFYNLMHKVILKSDEDIDGNEWITVYNGSDTYWLIEGLSMDKEYVFKIGAMSEFGSSNYSEESEPFYYPNRGMLIDSTEADLITISSGILGAILFVFVLLILFFTSNYLNEFKIILILIFKFSIV